MDELRSLEGMGSLLQPKNEKLPQITRAVSLMPKKVKRTTLEVIKSAEDSTEITSRSYSSRGNVPYDFSEDDQTPTEPDPNKFITVLSPSPNPNILSPDLQINASNNQDIPSLNANLLSINELIASDHEEDDDYKDSPFVLLHQLSNRSELDTGGGFVDLTLGLGGLNMDLVEDDEDYDGDNWYNDDILSNLNGKHVNFKIDLENDEKQSKTKKDKMDLNVDRFPIEEFKDYPSSTSDNKDNATEVNIIGSGSFGIVIKSFHLISCETVAIKQCRISEDEEMLSLFIQEANYYKMFNDSSYTVDVLGFGRNQNNNKLCIALEYMDLQSISRIDYVLEEIQLKYIAFCILSALDAMHQRKCIHNDVKPDNILINDRGDVKLTDFGCCLKMEDDQSVMTDNICGSKQYYAPEKWLISPPKYDTKSDIWSFGITFYEIVTLTMHSVREFGYSESPKFESKNDILSSFLNKMVIWDYNDRWNASLLLKHDFLSTEIKRKLFINKKAIKKESDVSFMVDALIEYYSNKNFYDKQKEQYTDSQKIDNLCKHSGCTQKEVNALIRFQVDKAKNKIQKHSKH